MFVCIQSRLNDLCTETSEQEQAVMWKHAQEKHRGKIPTYVMNVTGIFGDDAMLRQITESVLIRKAYEHKERMELCQLSTGTNSGRLMCHVIQVEA